MVPRGRADATAWPAVAELRAWLPASSAFDELNFEWSSCMRAAGCAETSPRDAYERLLADYAGSDATDARLSTDQGRALEIPLALTDLSCQQGIDCVSRHDEIDRVEQEAYAQNHAPELDALAAWLGPR